jgi:hypothetical protein
MLAMSPALVAFIWLAAALGTSLTHAYAAEINRRFKQDGYRLNLLRTSICAVFWLPVAAINSWQHPWLFYAAAIFGGVGMAIGNTIQNNLAAKHNGRVAIVYMPLKALVVFGAWVLIDPGARAHVLDDPMKVPLILGLFTIMVLAMNAMRKNDTSWAALLAVLPIVALYSTGDVLTRLAMPATDLGHKVVVFMWVVYATATVAGLVYYPWRRHPQQPLISPKLFHAAMEAAAASSLSYMCFLIALTKAPNPAYVSMICLLAPVWLLVYHRLRDVPDDANPYAGLVLVVAAMLLIGVTL